MSKLNEVEELDNFLRSAAISILHNDELHIKGGNIVGISYDLVRNCVVRVGTDSILIPHLSSFPFVHLMENEEDIEGRLTFAFNMDEFRQSEVLKAHAVEYVKDMFAHAKKLDLQASNTRKRATVVSEGIMPLSFDIDWS